MSNTRLPDVHVGGGLQHNNDPDNFVYKDNQSPDHYNNDNHYDEYQHEDDYRFEQSQASPHRTRRDYHSPNKTGGQIQWRDLDAEDLTHEPFIGRDATVVIEGEMRQFDNKKPDKVQRYVESLVTGNFMRVQKEVNLQIQSKDEDEKAKKMQSNREFFERQMKEAQRSWVNRTNKLFNMFLGFLAGMAVMHLIVILSQNDKDAFLKLYSNVCNIVQAIFMIITSFGFIFSITLSMIYRQKSDEKMRNMDLFRLEFRQHYVVSVVCTVMLSICMILLYIIPRYTNIFFYWNQSLITNSHITTFKGLAAATDVLFIICWFIASAFNKASISDMDMDPEEMEEGMVLDGETVDTE